MWREIADKTQVRTTRERWLPHRGNPKFDKVKGRTREGIPSRDSYVTSRACSLFSFRNGRIDRWRRRVRTNGHAWEFNLDRCRGILNPASVRSAHRRIAGAWKCRLKRKRRLELNYLGVIMSRRYASGKRSIRLIKKVSYRFTCLLRQRYGFRLLGTTSNPRCCRYLTQGFNKWCEGGTRFARINALIYNDLDHGAIRRERTWIDIRNDLN